MRNILFAVLIGTFLMVGTASADRGVWINTGTFGSVGGTGAWVTFFHIENPTGAEITATVLLYAADGASTLASTTRVLASNALWAFNSGQLGASSTLENASQSKGLVIVLPATLNSAISGYYTGTASGFNFWTQ